MDLPAKSLLRPYGQWLTRSHCPWDFQAENWSGLPFNSFITVYITDECLFSKNLTLLLSYFKLKAAKARKKKPENEEMQIKVCFLYSKCTQSQDLINIVKVNKSAELLRCEQLARFCTAPHNLKRIEIHSEINPGMRLRTQAL